MTRFFVRALATVLLLLVLAPTTQADTHQTVPSANFSFMDRKSVV